MTRSDRRGRDEPSGPGGRAMERRRQFLEQRGLPVDDVEAGVEADVSPEDDEAVEADDEDKDEDENTTEP